MRLQQVQNNYLYEGLDPSTSNSMMLWESAGFKLREAALTADQIQQLFQQIEQDATAAGDNRTLLGKGKDAASAVNKAWEDLKTKIQDSGPIKNVDAAYDSAVAKIEKGLGGPDNAVSKAIMKYREFAKKHPIAQGFIYSALIAAAGISGAGLGGAAVLGLLKMTDKLLQGEKFSSAAYSGAKTGLTAFAASKIGDLIKGVKPGEQIPPPKAGMNSGTFVKRDFDNYDYYLHPSNNSVVQVPKGMGSPFMPGTDAYNAREALKGAAKGAADVGSQAAASATQAGAGAVKRATGDLVNKVLDQSLEHAQGRQAAVQAISAAMKSGELSAAQGKQLVKLVGSAAFDADKAEAAITQALKTAAGTESIIPAGKHLSEGQVYLVFNRITAQQELTEGPLDFVKGAAAKGMKKIQQVGKNITTKVTADKLNKAWKAAGAPTDSNALADILKQQGVSDDIVTKVYSDMKLPAPGAGSSNTTLDIESVKTMIAKLPTDRKVRLIKYMTSQLKVA